MRAPRASDQHIVSTFELIALNAGRVACELFKAGCEVAHKADESPVTEADHAAEAIILAGLAESMSGVPVVAEEAVSAGNMPAHLGGEFLLVDPLDGTREFVSGKGDFTVNIALVRDGAPTIGVVYAPARGWLFSGRPGHAQKVEIDADYSVAGRRIVQVRECGAHPDVVASHSHRNAETDRMIAKMKAGSIIAVGSSLKFCLIAAGEADIYPRCSRTMQWDTAAGDAVLRAAGGMTSTMDGAPLTYGFRDGDSIDRMANPSFIARGGEAARV
jgi:3'(2'), 5'-bisphosphate nucleotidase